MRGYPRKFYPTLLCTLTALLLSGVLLIPTTLTMRLEWDVAWRLEANARIITAVLHVACAFFALTLFGSLWSLHMRAGWRQRRNHRNGIFLIGVLVILSLSGLGIFYLADEKASLYIALSHSIAGLLATFAFIYHAIAGRRILQQFYPTRITDIRARSHHVERHESQSSDLKKTNANY